MEFEINRINVIMTVVDEMLAEITHMDNRIKGYVHLYGVGQFAAMIAKKRGLDPELSQIAGLLHDYYFYKTGEQEDHAKKGGDMVLPILARTELFAICEMGIITKAISAHSDKDAVSDPYDEVLKDADVMQHILNNSVCPVKPHEIKRYEDLSREFGLKNTAE